MPDSPRPLVVGSKCSYFTGKLEAYLRYRELPYDFQPMTPLWFNRIVPRETGAVQMPALRLADGRWLTDTTPTIAWLETQHPEPAVIPRDPLQRFFSLLLEDHGDEWLWRPAMHYRWSYAEDRRLLGDRLAKEIATLPLPLFVRRIMIQRRQQGGYVKRDGVDRDTWAHVEGAYHRALEQLGAVFESRPFLLGARPTIADYGFFGSMFRHFGCDPTASRIMREEAPGVYEWVARVWNARVSTTRGELVAGIPDDWGPILREVAETHLEQLCANAEAWRVGRKRFDATIQGVRYGRLPTSRYRVWCLERLRSEFEALPDDSAGVARTLLEKHGCWEPLFRSDVPPSGHDPEGAAPFGSGLRVFPARI